MPGSNFIVGLTGGIGSGKSAAADFFSGHGAAVVDTDIVAHELTAPGGAAMAAIHSAFGDAVIAENGALDRAAMRRLVFGDAAAKDKLESILHPLIRAESRLRCERHLAEGAPYAVLVVPLLVESGTYRRRVSRVVVVDCEENTRIARVMSRSGLSQEEVQRIMLAQATRAERLAAADDVLKNDGDIFGLGVQVAALHPKYLQLAAKIQQTG